MTAIQIPLMRSTFFDETNTRKKLADFIQTAPKLSMGPECVKFEKEFTKLQECAHAILVTNGSTANLGLIQSLLNLGRLKKGDHVGVSAVTWATNVMPILQLGLIPVALDCSLDHLNVTADEVKKHLPTLQAVFITNVLGFCGDIDEIARLCKDAGVILIEDNCESLGTRHKGTLLGNVGLASTFSFFVGHHLSTIEGGMICTSDEELADMCTMVRAHGWDRNLSPEKQVSLRQKHHIDPFHAKYMFYELAYNIRPTEIVGFLGSLQLPLLPATIKRREENFRRFHTAVLSKPNDYHALHVDHIETVSNFSMPVITKSPQILQAVTKRFESAGVEIRPVIAGDITQHPFWTNALPEANCHNARTIHSQGFYFPNNADLTDDEVSRICSLL